MQTGNVSLSMRDRTPLSGAGRQAGFTYIAVLIAVAIIGVFLAEAGVVWHTMVQRERERQLLFVGDEFRLAIARYYNAGGTQGAAGHQYPQRLEDLLRDPRLLGVARYLRKIYHDPITGSAEWGLVRTTGDRIIGVYSLSEQKPLKQANFSIWDSEFEGKDKYSQWTFIYQPNHDRGLLVGGPGSDTLLNGGNARDIDTPQGPQWSSTNY